MTKPSSFKEMGLEDFLDDPFVALIMLCDGINTDALRRDLYEVRKRLKTRDQKAVEI